MIMGLAFVLVCLFFAARDIRWYTSLFLFYMFLDFVMLRHVHGVIRHAADGSFKRVREDKSSLSRAVRQGNRTDRALLLCSTGTIFDAL